MSDHGRNIIGRASSILLFVGAVFSLGLLVNGKEPGVQAIAAVVMGMCLATIFAPRRLSLGASALFLVLAFLSLTPLSKRLSTYGENVRGQLMTLLTPALAGAILGLPTARIVRYVRRPADRTRCPVCGYSLAGLSSRTCPECGRKAREPNAPGHPLRRPPILDALSFICYLWGALASLCYLPVGPSFGLFYFALVLLVLCVAAMFSRGRIAWIVFVQSTAGLLVGLASGALTRHFSIVQICCIPAIGSLISIELDRMCAASHEKCPLCNHYIREKNSGTRVTDADQPQQPSHPSADSGDPCA